MGLEEGLEEKKRVQESGWKRRSLGFGEGVVDNKVGLSRGVGGEEEVGLTKEFKEKKIRFRRRGGRE